MWCTNTTITKLNQPTFNSIELKWAIIDVELRILLGLLMIFILFLSCGRNKEYISKNRELNIKEIGSFFIKDSNLVLNYGFLSHFLKVNNTQYLVGLNNYFNKLEIVDLCDQITFTSLDFNKIEKFAINNFQAEEFSIISKDSIFLYSPENQKIALINILGELNTFFDLRIPIVNFQSDFFLEPLPVSTRSFYSYKNLLFIRSIPPYDWYSEIEFYNKPLIVSYDIKQNKFLSIFANFSSEIQESTKFLPIDYQNSFLMNFQKKIYIISERRDHYLYSFNLNTQEFNNKYPARSNYLDEFELQTRKLDMQVMRNSFIKNGNYINVLFNPYKKQYYRVVTHNQELINPNTGKLNHPINERPFSIIVLDENLKVIGEAFFENVPFHYMHLVPHKDGILTFYKDENNEDINHFLVFDFEY